MYHVKRLSPPDSEENINEEEIVRLFFVLAARGKHPKTTALSDMLNSQLSSSAARSKFGEDAPSHEGS